MDQLDAICYELEDTNGASRFSGLCLTNDVGTSSAVEGHGWAVSLGTARIRIQLDNVACPVTLHA